jgi:alkylhydroperoxidase/carboxymuconolactone decarboxylase family protein YurZ
MFRVWKGPGEPHDSDEEWGAATKIQAHMPAKVMDNGVQVAQMLDDLFVPRDVEDLVAEAAGTNTGDAEAPAVEVIETNTSSRVDGINIVNMVQQAFSIMEQLAAIPESMRACLNNQTYHWMMMVQRPTIQNSLKHLLQIRMTSQMKQMPCARHVSPCTQVPRTQS